jgi:polyisoprenoid-binding protein YceI
MRIDTGTHLQPGTWTVDTASTTASFVVRELTGTVHGTIPVLEGRVEIDDDGRPVTVTATLDVAAIHTGLTARDRSVRGRRILDTARHPELRYGSRSITATADGWRVDGVLQVAGREGRLVLTVRADPPGPAAARRVFATGVLDRRSVGITRLPVSRTIAIEIAATLTPRP